MAEATAMGSIFQEKGVDEGRVTSSVEQDEREEGFHVLVEQYTNLAYNVALRMLHNVEDAEDAVQEAFLSAYRAFTSFRGQSKASTWLYRIVVNTCLMKIRKEKARAGYLTVTDYEDEVVHDWGADPERAAINGELQDELEGGLRRLSPELRATVVLRDVQGFATEDAADVLGISVPALKARLHRARCLLRMYLVGYVVKPAHAG